MIAVITTDLTITDNNLKVVMNKRQSERSVDTMLDMHVCKIIYTHANFPRQTSEVTIEKNCRIELFCGMLRGVSPSFWSYRPTP